MHVDIGVEEIWYLNQGGSKNGRRSSARTATTREGNVGGGGIQIARVRNRERTDSPNVVSCCSGGTRPRSTDETDGRGGCITNTGLNKRNGANHTGRAHRANHGTRARASTPGKHDSSICGQITSASGRHGNKSDYVGDRSDCRSGNPY